MTYAAYLRVYEPLTAFHEPDRSRWAAYADSAARPRRLDALAAEQLAVLSSLITLTPGMAPARESEHAYVRRDEGVTYVCPWQTRLRHLLGAGREPGARPYISTSAWTVPAAWFVLFAGGERWVCQRPGRTLLYVTTMTLARRRAAKCAAALHQLTGRQVTGRQASDDDGCPGGAAGAAVRAGAGSSGEAAGMAVPAASAGPAGAPWGCWTETAAMTWPEVLAAEVAVLRRWLERFHPGALVELDYGGLVHVFSDAALRADESAAEIGAAVDGAGRGHYEVATAMYQRLYSRWLPFSQFEQVN